MIIENDEQYEELKKRYKYFLNYVNEHKMTLMLDHNFMPFEIEEIVQPADEYLKNCQYVLQKYEERLIK